MNAPVRQPFPAAGSPSGAGFAHYEMMSAGLLAREPLELPDRDRELRNWRAAFSHFEARLNSLRMWRYRIWAHWAELAKFILPRRYHWLIVANRMDKGSPINDAIVDSTATLAMQVCASGLWTGLMSPSRPWFNLAKALPWVELEQDAKEWIEDTQQRIYAVLGKSNVYTIAAQAFQDIVVFGTAPLILYEDYKDVIRAYLPCAGEYFLASSARLVNDTLYREFTLTVENIVAKFGARNCPDQILKLWRAGRASLDQEFIVAHAIQPNFRMGEAGAEFRLAPPYFDFIEVYWLRGQSTDAPLSVRGFTEKPFFVGRWSTVSNDAYGRSIGMDALPDVKQLQLETKRKGEFIDKGVRPPMGADVSLKNEPSSIIAGQVTYIPTGSLAGAQHGFFPLFMPQPAWLQGITADIEAVKKRIETAFFVDVFMAITRMEGVQPRNELELTKRDLERLQVLGPFVEQFETEFAGPLIERVLKILVRRNMLKPAPPSMRGVGLKIEYVSIMKLAQRSAELVAMKDVLATAGALSNAAQAAFQPNPIRVINLDKSMRKYADLGGFPSECLYTEAEVQQNDAIHAQAHQNAMAQQQTMQAVQAAQSLSKTNTGPGNALGELLGRGGVQTGTPAGVTGNA